MPADRAKSVPRVLRIITRMNMGGPARHVVILNEGLRSRGYETFLTYGTSDCVEGSLESLIAERALAAVCIPQLGRRIHPWRDFTALVKLIRLMKRFEPDIVHTHLAKAGIVGRMAASIYNMTRKGPRRCIVIHTFHGHLFRSYFGRLGTRAAQVAERCMALLSDRLVVISPGLTTALSEEFRIAPARKFVTIPLGLELDPLFDLRHDSPSLRETLNLEPDDVVFGYIGRFAPIKNLPGLLRGFAIVVEEAPQCRLILAGDGDARAELERLARDLRIVDQVRFIGWRTDLSAFYSTLDAVVISSRNEGTPVAAIEGMAAGRPIVATAVGGIPDIIQDGVSGLLVRPDDPEHLGVTMARLARNPQLRTQLGHGARARATQFTRERLMGAMAALYETELRRRRLGADAVPALSQPSDIIHR